MDAKLVKALQQKDETPEWHSVVLNSTRELVDMSRRAMSNYHKQWDANNDVYRGYRQADEQDKKAKDRKEPQKMVVPITYSQAQTFASFMFTLYTQRERFFELSGVNEKSHQAAKIAESLLQRDLVYNCFEAKLYQLLIDVARFSMGVIKTSWCRKTQMVREEQVKPAPSFMGITLGQPTSEWVTEERTKFLGNELMSVSPYRFYPDTRLPITRFQEGEFCASEDEYSYTQLQEMEANGYVAGIDNITGLSKNRVEARGGVRMTSGFQPTDSENQLLANSKTRGTVVVTEVQLVITPSTFHKEVKALDKVLDRSITRPIKYLIWYANDSRIIRFEPLNYLHDQFTYDVALFSPDQNELCGMSLADTIDQLQSVITWFINARITSVRKVIQNYLVVDTEGVEIKDLENRNPIIRLKPNAGGRGIDRWIKQLAVNDVTTNHLTDAKYLEELVQQTTGINDNIMGQVGGGRRSATERQNSFVSAANRLKMTAVLMFRMCFEPMGTKMVSNLRDGLDEETMVKVVGLNKTQKGLEEFKGVTRRDLVGQYSFDVFDGTLPSEKAIMAETFKELLGLFMKSPEAAIALGIDPKECFTEWMELRGVKNPERFFLPSPPPAQLPQPGAAPTTVQPQIPASTV